MKSRRALSFHLGVFLSSGLLALLVYSTCNAQTFSWVQSISTNTTTNWSPGLWSPAGGPNAADHIGSFEITGSGGTLTVNNTPTITLGGISTTATNSRSLNINGGVMTLSTTTGTPTFNLAGTGGPIITISSQLSGTQGFVKTGGLRLGLNGNNSGLSGPISINAGSIALGHNNALGTGTVTLAGGQLNGAFNGVRTVANNFVVNSGNFTQDTTNGLVNQAILRVNGTTQVNLSSGNLFAAAANAGTIQLIHFNNTVSGGSAGNSFTINNGADNGNVGAIFSSANSFAHNIILSQGGVSPTDGLGKRGSVGLVAGNDTAFSTANITIQSGVQRSYLASSDSTARTLANNVTWQANNETTGGAPAFTLTFGRYTAQTPPAGTPTPNANPIGGVGDIAINNLTVSANTGAVAATFRRIEVTNATVATINGVFSRTGSLPAASLNIEKTGTGTLVLANSGNTYNGGFTVNAGTLRVNGNLGGTGLTVNSGATLDGTGIISAPTTVSSGATLAPGNSPGVLTFNSALTLGGTTVFELNSTSRGSGYDGINTGSGLLTYGGTVGLLFGSAFLTGDTVFDLFQIGSGGFAGTFSSIASTNHYAFTLNSGNNYTSSDQLGNIWSFSHSTGDLTFIITAVPEPSTVMLLLVGGALVWVRRRPIRAKCFQPVE